MFRTQPHAFSQLATDLYRPSSFQPPASQVDSGPSEPEWLCYGPDGDQPAPPFADFMRTPRFAQIQAQILARSEQCRQFANKHLSAAEAARITSAFDAFEAHVRTQDGMTYFGPEGLALLYGLGKRSLDDFCRLLEHADIALHQRTMALRELASQVHVCLAAAPAFMHALELLRQPEGSLHGQYWQALTAVLEHGVLEYVREGWSRRPGWSLDQLESHLVNRLKLELGLPGGNPDDRFSQGRTLVSSREIQACGQWLLRECRPAVVALHMAGTYRARLLEGAAQALGVAPSEIVPNEDVHMQRLRATAARLAPAFQGVSLGSLLEEDLDNGGFRWRAGDSLVARDLLLALAEQGFIEPPKGGLVLRAVLADSAWDIRHLDGHLFYARGGSQARFTWASIDAVTLAHLQAAWRQPGGARGQRLVDTVLEGDDAEALLAFPAPWLTSRDQAVLLLRRLGPVRAGAWVAAQTMTDDLMRWVLPAVTDLGDGVLLRQLLRSVDGCDGPRLLDLAGGPGILARACAQGDDEVSQAWLEQIEQRHSAWDEATLRALLAARDGGSLVHQVLLRGSPHTLGRLLELISLATASGVLPRDACARHLRAPVRQALAAGRVAPLTVLGNYLIEAVREEWLSSDAFPFLLDGGGMGEGGAVAARAGSAEGVRWYMAMVAALVRDGGLTPAAGRHVLDGDGRRMASAAATAVLYNDATCFAETLAGAMQAVEAGWMSSDQFVEYVELPGQGLVGGVAKIMLETDGACARAWTDALLVAFAKGWLSQDQVAGVIGTAAVAGLEMREADASAAHECYPLVLLRLRGRLRGGQAFLPESRRLIHWGESITRAWRAGALRHEQVLALLACERGGLPGLSVAMSVSVIGRKGLVLGMIDQYFQARRDGLVDDEELEQLLAARPTGGGRKAVDGAEWTMAWLFVQELGKRMLSGEVSPPVWARLVGPFLQTRAGGLRDVASPGAKGIAS